jgi:D-sedoheptulose 7-phosphate isomerase
LKETSVMFDKTLDEHLDCFKMLERLRDPITQAAGTIISVLRAGRKILICGNGGSASDAQHFAAEFVGRFTRERNAWPALALNTDTSLLTAVANDYGYDNVFSRQVEALGRPDDVLIGISTSGNSENVIRAMRQANTLGLQTIALTGGGGGTLAGAADIAVRAPSHVTARIQEAHIFILHFWADTAEAALTEQKDPL